ncbi:MAG TPA: SDR family NAD(P)-dependent oxidoreductase [Virgibacillus sp.]|nr:SDR family NAD(P)-dependent oxidoreductase [Virgibacillus sp.]HLR67060.1 SDR family NAD(P)-dependent oxidoreductase [Virgibacillus sp.]
MEFKQKTVVVTGGVSGLGEATVRMALSKKANVVALDVNEEKGKKLQEEFGDKFLFVPADVIDVIRLDGAIRMPPR